VRTRKRGKHLDNEDGAQLCTNYKLGTEEEIPQLQIDLMLSEPVILVCWMNPHIGGNTTALQTIQNVKAEKLLLLGNIESTRGKAQSMRDTSNYKEKLIREINTERCH